MKGYKNKFQIGEGFSSKFWGTKQKFKKTQANTKFLAYKVKAV